MTAHLWHIFTQPRFEFLMYKDGGGCVLLKFNSFLITSYECFYVFCNGQLDRLNIFLLFRCFKNSYTLLFQCENIKFSSNDTCSSHQVAKAAHRVV